MDAQLKMPIFSSSDPEVHRSLFRLIEGLSDQYHMVSLRRQIEACRNLLQQEERIDVAMLGQLKAGKSSFVNSLIGRPVLPIGVVPVTTTVTRLRYGQKEKALIHLLDQRNSPKGRRSERATETAGG